MDTATETRQVPLKVKELQIGDTVDYLRGSIPCWIDSFLDLSVPAVQAIAYDLFPEACPPTSVPYMTFDGIGETCQDLSYFWDDWKAMVIGFHNEKPLAIFKDKKCFHLAYIVPKDDESAEKVS